jgi:hypothetical protein
MMGLYLEILALEQSLHVSSLGRIWHVAKLDTVARHRLTGWCSLSIVTVSHNPLSIAGNLLCVGPGAPIR